MLNCIDAETLELVQAVQAGEEQAFELLYARYAATVFRTAYLIVGNANDAEEIMQDVFLRVYRKLPTYRTDRGTFSAWIYRITVNLCLSWRRRRLPRHFNTQLQAIDSRIETNALSPLEHLLRNEEQRSVWQAVQQLSPKLRAVIVLRYYQNLSYEEIATVLECPLGTVRSRLHAAHKQLLTLLSVRMDYETLSGRSRYLT